MAWRRSKSSAPSPDRPARSAPVRGPSTGGAMESLIAEGMVLDGDCHTDGPLRVEGRVTGNVRANRLIVGPSGRVEGDVTGGGAGGPAEDTVVIEGRVDGSVAAPRVEIGRDGAVGDGMEVEEAVVRGRVAGGIRTEGRLLLEATAVVRGNVSARRLGLTEGGQVFGTIRIGEPSEEASPTESEGTQESGESESAEEEATAALERL